MQAADDCSVQSPAPEPERRLTVTWDRTTRVFPSRPTERRQYRLSASDLQMLGCNYIQKGLLFEAGPSSQGFEAAVDRLERGLSEALAHFYPLAGRLMEKEEEEGGCMYVDCNDAGVDFIEASASADAGVAEMANDGDDQFPVIRHLFALDGAVNYDGRFLPLLAVQVTKMSDGLAVGVTLNHAVADGTSLWHFVSSWAQLCRGSPSIAVRPIHDRSLGRRCFARLQLTDSDIPRWHRPPRPLREKVFRFGRDAISALKDRARDGAESGPSISSFQALSAHVWRAVTRARGLGSEEATTLKFAVNCRPRLEPPLPPAYFGNAIQNVHATVTVAQLLGNDLSFVARFLHRLIKDRRDANIREAFDRWEKAPVLFKMNEFGANDVGMGSSPRFAVYDNDFGWGKPVAVRSGSANKFDGKVSAYQGREGEGSVDLEICLSPQHMNALESDQQFVYGHSSDCNEKFAVQN